MALLTVCSVLTVLANEAADFPIIILFASNANSVVKGAVAVRKQTSHAALKVDVVWIACAVVIWCVRDFIYHLKRT